MSNNTIVRGCLVPSLKNKPLDGRQDVPTLADIANIENPYVNFIFPVEETGKWYKVLSLTDKVIDELVIPNGMIDEYEEFGGGMTDTQKQEYLTKSLAEQMYLKKEDAVNEYLNKTEAKETYQQKGDYATNKDLNDLRNEVNKKDGAVEVVIGENEPSLNEVKLWVDTSVTSDDTGGEDGEGGGDVNPDTPSKQYETLNLIVAAENGAAISAIINVNGKDVSVSSASSHSEKFEYGTEYTITPQAVSGYVTPEPMIFTAGQEIRTVTLNYEYQVKITTIQINQNIADPGMMVTRIIDNGGIEAIRANSHRYESELRGNTMYLRQLKDNNSILYADGTYADKRAIYDTLMKLPQFYYKAEELESDIWNISFAYGGKPDDTWQEWDGKLMYGAYTSYLDYCYSRHNYSYNYTQNPVSIAQLMSKAINRGTGYWYMSLRDMNMLYFLFVAYYNSLDISILGTNENSWTTGWSDNIGMNDTISDSDCTNFWGLESYCAPMICFNERLIESTLTTEARNEVNIESNTEEAYSFFSNDYTYVLKRNIGDRLSILPKLLGGTSSIGYMAKYKAGVKNNNEKCMVVFYGGNINFSMATTDSIDGTGKYFRMCYYGDYIIEK